MTDASKQPWGLLWVITIATETSISSRPLFPMTTRHSIEMTAGAAFLMLRIGLVWRGRPSPFLVWGTAFSIFTMTAFWAIFFLTVTSTPRGAARDWGQNWGESRHRFRNFT